MFRWGVNRRIVFSALFSTFALFCSNVSAQELTPRAYWPLPNGVNVLVAAYQHTSGDIVTDPSLPITGVDSSIDFFQLSYQRSLSLFGRASSVQISLPYSQGKTEGFVEGEFLRRETSGLTDARARLAINLKGAPSMDGAGFQALRKKPRTIIGASLLVQMPTGEYEPDKVINLGTNRWSVKPAIGVIWPLHPTWLVEAEVGAWFFSDNDNFVGQTRQQDPILSTEFHLVKRIAPGFWASLDANFYVGGRTQVDGIRNADLQRNSRAGVTVVLPVKGRHALRGSFSTGIATESGGDFEIFNLSYLYAW